MRGAFRSRLSPFWRQAGALIGGNAAAHLISGLSVLLLPRLFADADFGRYGWFSASLAVLAVVVNGGYDLAVMLPADAAAARRLVLLSLRIAAAVAGLTLLAALLHLSPLGPVPGVPPGAWLLWLPLSLALEGAYQPLRVWANRQQAYGLLSASRLARALGTLGVSMLLGWAGAGAWGLAAGWTAGQAAGLLPLLRRLLPQLRGQPAGAARAERRAFADFPRYAVAGSLLHTASRYLPVYLLLPAFGEALAGQFSQADRILSLPVTVIAMAIGQVFYEQAGRAAHAGTAELKTLVRRTLRRLALIGAACFVPVLLLGPWLFRMALGDAWADAGRYAQWLAPWMYLAFIASPLAYLVDVTRRLGEFLRFNAVFFLLRLAVLAWGARNGGADAAIAAFAAASAAGTALQLGYLLRLPARAGRPQAA
ncbi:MAG: oligosaccharide flippase family protein [Bacteroidia bacterium]|nr:oligosaccharide flippase family protein [Bacteroidia bacterium]